MCADGIFTETTAYDLNSTYFAAKASSNHFVRACGETFARPFVLTNCSNNYGPNHFLEKLIPRFINNIININPLPVYGDGNYTRDWFFVEDPAVAIDLVFHDGNNHETYNISGFDECKNIHSVQLLCQIMNRKLVRSIGTSAKLIIYLKDRPGHDLRCASQPNQKFDVVVLGVAHREFLTIDFSKLQNENSLLYDVKGILGTRADGRL